MDQMRNNPGKFIGQSGNGQVSPGKLSFTQKYNNLSSGTRAGIQMGASVAGNAIYNLASGNRSTTAGGVMSGLGDAAIASGNPYAMAAGLAAKGLGAFINRGWGNDPEAMLRYNGHINGLLNQDYSGDPVAAINRGMSGIKINRNDFGLFKGGDYNDMVNKMKFAQGWADRSGEHAVDNWGHKMVTDGLSTHYALGGLLETDTPIGYSMAV
jgi:hypothetical protein